ncbi:MAG TPA: hypothetical protein VN042_04665 [Asticcacaulis sp.]|nr:hypothetical protein [Asticcacaulis sp.]
MHELDAAQDGVGTNRGFEAEHSPRATPFIGKSIDDEVELALPMQGAQVWNNPGTVWRGDAIFAFFGILLSALYAIYAKWIREMAKNVKESWTRQFGHALK